MLASINWLKQYVDITLSPEDLAEKLTRAGLEVEQVIHLGKGLEGVITGKVAQIERHPNSDHLWVCQMDLGQGELVQILTGAQNVKQGNLVPVAVVGSTLPKGMTLKKAKMRGLDSNGMLCSAEELGIDAKLLLPEQREGIFILPDTTPIGVDVKDLLGLNDVVLDIDLTANRGDCFNMLGLAREIGALTKVPVRLPELSTLDAAGGNVADLGKVSIECPDLCSRFALRMVKNIKVTESPEWMQKVLRAVGIRPISNVVDVTNYVMMELGQPMHAYDYDQVKDHTWIVRRAKEGETLVTLDSQKRDLTPDMIVIADPEKAIGLGGVMGGLATEVTDKTVNVMLESATFHGPTIRRTSKALGLRSEASQRFERGVDTITDHDALNRAVHLLEEMGACQSVAGIVEAYPVEVKPVEIKAVPAALRGRIGMDISDAEMEEILTNLNFTVNKEADGSWRVIVPTWRKDCTCDADLSEEVARMYGYDRLPSTLPQLDMAGGGQAPVEDVKDTMRDYLTDCGLNEIMSYTFINANCFDKLGLQADDARRQAVQIMNPISDDFKTMRTTMVPSLLNTAAYNQARQNDRIALFEVGRVFIPKGLPITEQPEEKTRLCIALSGRRNELNWTESKDSFDFFDLKGVFEGLMEKLQVTGLTYRAADEPFLHPGKSAYIVYNDNVIGFLGAVHPQVQERFGLSSETYVLECDVNCLTEAAKRVPQFTHIPQFPNTSRDIAVVVPQEVSAADLQEEIRSQTGPLLTSVKLFDVYTGKQVKEGCKSVAFSLTFQDLNKTLQDQEIDPIIKKVVDHVQTTFQGILRD